MEKEFKTIDEQIEILKSRNMQIENYDNAYQILKKHNYYYLINGYKDVFINKTDEKEKYIDKVDIQEIYSLYLFDKKLKINFLKYLLLIENEINTYISYEFSKSYGHKNYLIFQNFNNSKKQKSTIKKFIEDINLEIKYQYKNSNKMIIHYLDNYSYVPLWVLVRILSFGKISKFYSLMKEKDQNSISKKYNLRTKEFKILLHNLTLIRNICAHDEKLYDVMLKNRINSNKYHKILRIKSVKGNYILATRDLFSIVIILKLLLSREEFNGFYRQVLKDIKNLKSNIKSVDFNLILEKMGFPRNYTKLLKLK